MTYQERVARVARRATEVDPACLARNIAKGRGPREFINDGIEVATAHNDMEYVKYLQENREEAEQIVAGIWGLL